MVSRTTSVFKTLTLLGHFKKNLSPTYDKIGPFFKNISPTYENIWPLFETVSPTYNKNVHLCFQMGLTGSPTFSSTTYVFYTNEGSWRPTTGLALLLLTPKVTGNMICTCFSIVCAPKSQLFSYPAW